MGWLNKSKPQSPEETGLTPAIPDELRRQGGMVFLVKNWSYNKAKRELSTFGMWSTSRGFEQELVQSSNLNPEANFSIKEFQQLPKNVQEELSRGNKPTYQRYYAHIFRLITHQSGEEREFARALLQFGGDSGQKLERSLGDETGYRARDVIKRESSDTCMWWTFAPYLYQALLARKINPEEALKKLYRWAATGDVESYEAVHLKGLDDFGRTIYILDEDPSDTSHTFTRERSKALAKVVARL